MITQGLCITVILLFLSGLYGYSTGTVPNRQDTTLYDVTQIDDSGQKERFVSLIRHATENWKTAPATSLRWGHEALSLARELNNKAFEATAHNSIGVAYSYTNAYAQALDHFFDALSLREELEEPHSLATNLNNIGNVYYQAGNHDQALHYYLRSLEIQEEQLNEEPRSSTLINIASLYNTQGEQGKALPYIEHAISLLEAARDSASLSTAWNNLGNIYLNAGDTDKALEYNHKALEVSKALDQAWDTGYIFFSIGTILLEKQAFDQAIAYIREGQEIARKLNSQDLIMYGLRVETLYHGQRGNSDLFTESFRQYDAIKDSIFSDEQNSAIAEMQVIYETEQREKENAIQQLQLTRERSIRNSFIFITSIILIGVIIIYRRYRIKQSLNKRLEKQVQLRTADLIQSHEQITSLNERLLVNSFETEERERKRFSEDLHDGLGPILSTVRIHLELIAEKQKQEQHQLIQNAKDLLDDAIYTAKDIANNLTPNVLSDFGLKEALSSYADKINALGEVTMKLEADLPDTRYSLHTELALYRICLELINNSLKHAKAKHLNINLTASDHRLHLYYTDDGVGFDQYTALDNSDERGLGLSNIVSRSKSIGGTHTMLSGKGQGLQFTLEVPLTEKQKNQPIINQ